MSKKIYNLIQSSSILLIMIFAGIALLYPSNAAVDEQKNTSVDIIDNKVQTTQLQGAFELKSYMMNVDLKKDHSAHVEQKITVNIPDNLDVISFSIPSGNFKITDLRVENAVYKPNKSQSASTISIIEPDKLKKGVHTYRIAYTIKEFIDTDDTKDVLYFKPLLPEWMQPIGELSIKIKLPSDMNPNDVRVYSGQFGIQDSVDRIEVSRNSATSSIHITGNKVPENYGIIIKADLQDGYWIGALDEYETVRIIIGVLLLPIIILLIIWFAVGRDPKVEYDKQTLPLNEIFPFDIGYIFSRRVNSNDMLSLIMYMAVKGYLKISEYAPSQYSIIRKKNPIDEEKLVRNAHKILFEGVYEDRALDSKYIGERLIRIKNEVSEDIASGFQTSEKLTFTKTSYIFRLIGVIIFAIATGTANALLYIYKYQPVAYVSTIIIALLSALLTYAFCSAVDKVNFLNLSYKNKYGIVGLILSLVMPIYMAVKAYRMTSLWILPLAIIISSAASLFLLIIIRARGEENIKLYKRIVSLKQFTNNPDPKSLVENYINIENYFDEMIPYTVNFENTETWAISFVTLDVRPPEWYSNDIEGFTHSGIQDRESIVGIARDIVKFCRLTKNAYHEVEKHYGINI